MKLMGYRFVEQYLERAGLRYTDWCAHSIALKTLYHGVLAVGYGVESDTDACEVKIRDSFDSVNSGRAGIKLFPGSSDLCPRGSVNFCYSDGQCTRFLLTSRLHIWSHCGDQLSLMCSQRLVVKC